jgi:hypothetical protein
MTHYRSSAAETSLSDFIAALLGTLHSRRPSSRAIRRRLREIAVSAPANRALAKAWTLRGASPVEMWIHG